MSGSRLVDDVGKPYTMRFAQGKLRGRAGSLGKEMLRCAQHDNPVPYCCALISALTGSGRSLYLSMTVLDLTAVLWQGDRVPLIVTGGGR